MYNSPTSERGFQNTYTSDRYIFLKNKYSADLYLYVKAYISFNYMVHKLNVPDILAVKVVNLIL
jgi:hypothetical protein